VINKGQSFNSYIKASIVVQNFRLSHLFFLKIAKAQHSIDLVKLDRAGGENQTSENEARSFSSKEYEKC